MQHHLNNYVPYEILNFFIFFLVINLVNFAHDFIISISHFIMREEKSFNYYMLYEIFTILSILIFFFNY